MDVKKTFKADLRNKRSLLLEIGAVAALTMVVVAFSYTPRECRIAQKDLNSALVETDTVAIMQPEELKQPLVVESQLLQQVALSVGRRPKTKPTDSQETDSLVEIVELLPIQEGEPPDDYHVDPPPESLPRFNGGGLEQFQVWVRQNVKFPRIALESDVQGRVVLSFVVDKDGSLTDIEVLRSPHHSLSNEVVRVLNKSPKWIPGKIGDRAVPVKFVLPVDFRMLN